MSMYVYKQVDRNSRKDLEPYWPTLINEDDNYDDDDDTTVGITYFNIWTHRTLIILTICSHYFPKWH